MQMLKKGLHFFNIFQLSILLLILLASCWCDAQRLHILQDPPPLEVIVANLIEVARRWAEVTAGEMPGTALAGQDTCQRRQQIVVEHLAALNSMRSRSHATQNMVQHSLCTVKFLVAFPQLFAVGIWEA